MEPTPEAVEAYWRLKLLLKKKGAIEQPAVYALMRAIAPLFNDQNWPDLSMFNKLFIDEKDAG